MKALCQPQHWVLLLVLSATLTACTTNPTNDALIEAREAVQRAEQSQAVVEHAPRQLQEAQNNLSLAQRGWEEYGNDRQEEVDHLAYMAERQALAAMEQAAAAETRQKIANMDTRRKEVLLEARNRELEAQDQELTQLREETQSRQREAEELRNRVESLKAEATERGLVLTLGEILFDLNETQLKPGGVNAIGRLAEFLQENPQRKILIEGHTDALGDEGYNMELSRERAQAVQQQLAQFGIPRERIDVRGYGEQFPVASNDTAAGRQQNRRVEIVVADQGETPESRPPAGTSSR